MKCKLCKGTGKLKGPSTFPFKCPVCLGTKKVKKCRVCNGTGHRKTLVCVACKGNGAILEGKK